MICARGRSSAVRHLIELGGLVVKAGIVDLIGVDRAIILGALIWMAEKLDSMPTMRLRPPTRYAK